MFDPDRATLIIARGLPGAGKSTLASLIAHHAYYEADMFFIGENDEYKFDGRKIGEAQAWCRAKTEHALYCGYTVLVCNTFSTEREVQDYIEIANKTNANFISLIVENRHGSSSIHNVPLQSIARMKHRFSVKL